MSDSGVPREGVGERWNSHWSDQRTANTISINVKALKRLLSVDMSWVAVGSNYTASPKTYIPKRCAANLLYFNGIVKLLYPDPGWHSEWRDQILPQKTFLNDRVTGLQISTTEHTFQRCMSTKSNNKQASFVRHSKTRPATPCKVLPPDEFNAMIPKSPPCSLFWNFHDDSCHRFH